MASLLGVVYAVILLFVFRIRAWRRIHVCLFTSHLVSLPIRGLTGHMEPFYTGRAIAILSTGSNFNALNQTQFLLH